MVEQHFTWLAKNLNLLRTFISLMIFPINAGTDFSTFSDRLFYLNELWIQRLGFLILGITMVSNFPNSICSQKYMFCLREKWVLEISTQICRCVYEVSLSGSSLCFLDTWAEYQSIGSGIVRNGYFATRLGHRRRLTFETGPNLYLRPTTLIWKLIFAWI